MNTLAEGISTSASEIPVIDLSDFDSAAGRARIAKEVREACVTVGFFLITGHGIPTDVREGMREAAKRYFALPDSERQKDATDVRFRRGYMHMPGSPRDSYELSLDLPLDDPDVVAGRFLHGPNHYPENHPWFQAAVEPYLAASLALGERLERLFAISLDVDESFFVDLCKKPTLHMRLQHYYPQTEEQRVKELAVPAHTDLGMFTILFQDPNGGLEIQRRDETWLKCPQVEGAFVVNVGDMLEIWTNDLYVSTPHRVFGLNNRDRYSIPVFFSPAFNTLVECIPSCLKPGETPKHEPMVNSTYLQRRLGLEGKEYGDPVRAHRREPSSLRS
jgi:isopenicillin N synthase-like dioxygenase